MTTMGGNIQTVPVESLATRPDLFQFRDDAGGYDKATVDTLVRTWDWNRYDPVSVVRDPESGNMIVLGGHHRYEAIQRLPDENPDQAASSIQVRVIEGDIGDADARAELQRQAILSNYSVRGTSLLADSEAVKRFEQEGQSVKQIADAMNERRSSKIRDLSAFGELHLADRQFVQTVPDFYPVAVELGHAVKKGMSPDEAAGLLRLFRNDYDETGRMPSRTVVKNLISLPSSNEGAGQQASFMTGDTANYNAVMQWAQDNERMEREIRSLKRQLAACASLSEETGTPIGDIERPILERISEMEQSLSDRKKRLTEDAWSGDVAETEPDDAVVVDMWGETVAAAPADEIEDLENVEDPPDFVQSGPGLFDAPEPEPALGDDEQLSAAQPSAIQQTTMGDDFATNRTLGMPMGEGRASAAPLADPEALQAAQERRDAVAAGQMEMPDELESEPEDAAAMVVRDQETGEEVRVIAVKEDDGQMAVSVESEGEPGPLFEAASEAAVEVAEAPTGDAPELSDAWRSDFEESLQELQTETFEGRQGWQDLQDYIAELQANRDQLEGTAALAWADRWDDAVTRPTKQDTADAASELRDALAVSLGMEAGATTSPSNPWEMFTTGAAASAAPAPKGKRGQRGGRKPKEDILTERVGATEVKPPPVLMMR